MLCTCPVNTHCCVCVGEGCCPEGLQYCTTFSGCYNVSLCSPLYKMQWQLVQEGGCSVVGRYFSDL